MKRFITLLLGCLLSANLTAAPLVIKAANLVDVEQGKLIKNPLIIIEGNQFQKVGEQGKLPIPENAKILDLGEQTVLPGLMDMHVHLTSSASHHGYKRLAISLPRSALYGVVSAKKTLMAGFTTVRNVGAPGFADVALRDSINDGDIVGPRMFVSGPSIGITGGHCDNNLLPWAYKAVGDGVADGPWAARQKVRNNIKYGADVIKVCATGGVLSKGTKVGAQQLSFEELSSIVAEAKIRGVVTAAHAHGTDGIKAAIKAGINSIEHASFIDEEGLKLAKKHGTYLSMDIYVTEYILGEGEKAGILEESLAKERTVGKIQRDNFRKALDAGINMVFGSDAGVYPHGDNPKQFSRMVKFGMTPMQAIQTATIQPARLLNQATKLGSISEGKLADLVAVKGNPLNDISLLENVTTVIKDGKIFKQ